MKNAKNSISELLNVKILSFGELPRPPLGPTWNIKCQGRAWETMDPMSSAGKLLPPGKRGKRACTKIGNTGTQNIGIRKA